MIRYHIDGREACDGTWVRHADVERLEAENAALRETVKSFMTVALQVPLDQFDDMPMPMGPLTTSFSDGR